MGRVRKPPSEKQRTIAVSVDPALKVRIAAFPQMNWSRIARVAFRAALAELESGRVPARGDVEPAARLEALLVGSLAQLARVRARLDR